MIDRPLLALTRIPADGSQRASEAVAAGNMRQLVQLRWLAVLGQLVTILVAAFAFGVKLPLHAMLGVVALLALANLASGLLLETRRVYEGEFLLALLFDVAALTAQLYLSGGVTNPFISLYLVQVVLGAILLEPLAAIVLAVGTTCCFGLLIAHHRPLAIPPGLVADTGDLFKLGQWLSFALVVTLLVQFIGRISRNLRARDAYLADMRQRAAEEDHIVRMGLFASGAAHELGTPLASLAVILSDWQRLPKLARDPQLSEELRDMLAEVQRCKSIVTDILHSAGEPRSEALLSTDAAEFLDHVAEEWDAAHPGCPVRYQAEGIAGATVVADPALRQAIWNLLDNAAEASPDWIALGASRDGDMLVIAVRDRGPGFAPAMLANFGKPYQSSKGAGHGVGLFLVTNVARRLGGRVDPANMPGGGAEVKLLVPLASPVPRKK